MVMSTPRSAARGLSTRMRRTQIMMQLVEGKRPHIPDLDTTPGGSFPAASELTQLIRRCWEHDPAARPRFEEVVSCLRTMAANAGAANRQQQQQQDL